MFPEKITLTDDLIQLIIDTRKKNNLTAYQLSKEIGKNKSWLPNIENKRTKTITKSDLYAIFEKSANQENLRPEQYIVKNLPRNSMIELEDGVISPCYHVQEMLNVDSYDEFLNLPPEQREKEIDYYCNGRDTKLREKEVSSSVYRLSNTLLNKLKKYDLEKQEDYSRFIDIISRNFENDFERTIKLYGNAYCPSDPLSADTCVRTDFLSYLDNLIAANDIAIDMLTAKSFVYSFIEIAPYQEYSFFDAMKNWDYTSIPDVDKIHFKLEDIKNFHFCIYLYIEYATEYSTLFKKVPVIDYNLMFSKFYEALSLFIKFSKIDYNFEIHIPTKYSDIESIHQYTDKIIFDIEKTLHSKYKNYW